MDMGRFDFIKRTRWTAILGLIFVLTGCESFTSYYFINKTDSPVQLRAKGRSVHTKVDIDTTVEPYEELYLGLAGMGKHVEDLDSVLWHFDEIAVADSGGRLILNKGGFGQENLVLKKGMFYYHYYLTVWPSDTEQAVSE